MRLTRMLGVLLAGFAAALVIGTGSPAQATTFTLDKGGETVITTAPGVVKALGTKGVIAFACDGANTSVKVANNDVIASYTFPLTGGDFDDDLYRGTFINKGALTFVNLFTYKSVKVTALQYETRTRSITGLVPGSDTRISLFRVITGSTVVVPGETSVSITNLDVRLSATGATALNGALQTTVFTDGLVFGTAKVTFNI